MKERSLNNKRRKEDILKLRSEGKSYRQIEKELGCSKSLISYHCGNGNEKREYQKLIVQEKKFAKK